MLCNLRGLRFATEIFGWIKDIENHHSQHHQRAVQNIKVCLMRNEIAVEALTQLNRSVKISHHNATGREADSNGQYLGIGCPSRGPKEVEPQCYEDAHAGELDCDAANHDVRSWSAAFFGHAAACGGGDAAARALDGDGDQVEGDEDDEVEFCGDGAVLLAVLADHLAEDVVEPGGEEAGSWCFGQFSSS